MPGLHVVAHAQVRPPLISLSRSHLHVQVFVLKIKCELDNVASMQADENNKWILTMQSPDEGERREHVEVTKARNEELDGSR